MAGQEVVLVCLFCFPVLSNSIAFESIKPDHSLRDGNTLVSRSRKFELGFFSPADPEIRYLGIWYMNIDPQTVVWVANREIPLSDTMGALNFTSQGVLVLANSTNNIIWSSNVLRTSQSPIAVLLDSGNFVVRDDNNASGTFLWQSYDYPCDTHLPGMKMGINLRTGFETYFSSWKSVGDPAPGEFSGHMDARGYPQIVLKRRNQIYYRGGSGNGSSSVFYEFLTGTPEFKDTWLFSCEIVINRDEVYFKYDVQQDSLLARVLINSSGAVQLFSWSDKSKDWLLLATSKSDQCNNYGLCGVFGSCDVSSSSVCACLDGFTPKSPAKWDARDWSDGCVRRTPLECNNKDAFLKKGGIKLPDTSSSWYDMSIGLEECSELCAKNCSCTAYANIYVREGGNGCLLLFDEIIDLRQVDGNGQDLYIKLAASEIDKLGRKRSFIRKKEGATVVSCVMLAAVLIVGTIIYLCWKTKGAKDEGSKEDIEMPTFDLTTIANATNNFSSSNKIGEGGFGPVYKGTLRDGQEVAIKRLSKSSGQGMNEFKTEITLIAKLQHRNLVKLLGCCIHKDEKMLIYEYMPNRSLDFFIFDQTRSKILDWHMRFKIIGGIARGLVYLHQDSRLRIIHRDLKANNVLLDSNMNPKISDFGLARTFGGDQTEANTNRIVGTYGYMSPEYAMDGHFSVKSDVFSLGVLIKEIISGKKNRGFYHPDHNQNLLGHAWMLWTEQKPLQVIDENLNGPYDPSEMLRCIQVALLCAQHRPEDRPNMSSVVGMLSGENLLPEPKQPGFYMGNNSVKEESS